MQKWSTVLSIAAIVLSIVTGTLCIITMSMVLQLRFADPMERPISSESAEVPASKQDEQEPESAAPSEPESSAAPEVQDEQQGNMVRMDPITLPPENGTDWHFTFPLHNPSDETMLLQTIVICNYMGGTNGECLDEHVLDDAFFRDMNLEIRLAPGEEGFWDDWHPVVDFFDARTYEFVFVSDSGNDLHILYPFELSMDGAIGQIDYSGDMGQDLHTLRHGAGFEQEMHPGVYWVPAVSLGPSAYSNAQIHEMLYLTPEEKQEQIHTLYEAMQLYQVGNFASADDNIRQRENGIDWEHHKPGYDAVRTNCGCCATSANWLRYVLQGDYEQVGYIATSQRDGSGHIFNYILHDGWYYVIDMTHYRTDWIATAVESGNPDDYYASDFIAGNIHKVRDLQQYVEYVQTTYTDPPGMMFAYMADDCLAIDGVRNGSRITITYEDAPQVDLQVIFDDPNDSLDFAQVPPPQSRPNWRHEPDARY